jgi:tetraacyldisaccharide 4'-kinase
MNVLRVVDGIWEGEGAAASLARRMLSPLSRVFAHAVARRNARYDGLVAPTTGLPALSIGNLTVGGTGKTPIAAWYVEQLRKRGARPSIVMRGVGDDEWRVHGLLNRGVPVIVAPNRAEGLLVARTRGADCAVLDDAFQHRQVSRIVDVVLLSADRWMGSAHMLPAGPFREPLTALRRAHLVMVTVKAATDARVREALAAVRAAAPEVPCAIVRLVPGSIRLAASIDSAKASSRVPTATTGAPRPTLLTHAPAWLEGRSFLAVSAIGDPSAFEAQLRAGGAKLVAVRRFPDHHRFTAADVAALIRHQRGASDVICTLKDAVKLGPLWPREGPLLWYLSQSVVIEQGAEAIGQTLDQLLRARAGTTPTAG